MQPYSKIVILIFDDDGGRGSSEVRAHSGMLKPHVFDGADSTF